MDNPGWSLKVEFTNTELEDLKFEKIEVNRKAADDNSGEPWYRCEVEGKTFIAYCSPDNLRTVLRIFRDFAIAAKAVNG